MIELNLVWKQIFRLSVNLLGVLALGSILFAVPGYAEDGTKLAVSEKEIVVNQARFTVITPQCIRMEYSQSGKFVDEPSYFAVNRNVRYAGVKVSRKKNAVTIDTGVIKLVYTADGLPFRAENLRATIREGRKSIKWTPAMKNEANLGGAIRTLDVWDGAGPLDDGLISRNGWYLLDDSKGPLLTKDWVKSRPSDGGVDWYLFGYGQNYKAAIKSLTSISGSVPLPRKYILGVWYSRYWPYSSSEFKQIANEYNEHDFPLDVMVMDMDWHKEGWTGWSWNRKLIPDSSDLLQWLHGQGLKVTLNVHPADGVQPNEDMYADFMRAMGEDPATKKAIPYNVVDKKYMDTMFKYTHDSLTAEGVDFWWLDWQQNLFTNDIPELKNIQWLNEYYSNYTAKGGKRGVSFSRWGGWGDHRHPVHFSGDSSTSWRMLAFEVPFTSAAGNSGSFFWTHDIGGHGRGRNEESYTRWCQFGAFSAVMRAHSSNDASLDRRPWTYPKWAEDSMRTSMHLRSIFFPYTYSSVRESCSESIPFIRPMYIDNPKDEEAYKQPQQYMYGNNVLVSPVTEPGVGERKLARQSVWFPAGIWYNYFTGERFSAGEERLVVSSIDEFPLYIRGGVPMPMQKYTSRMGSSSISNLIVRCYPGADGATGSFTLYEDDGISDAYKRGAFAITKLSYNRKGNRITVTIKPTEHTYKGQLVERAYTIELPCTLPAKQVEIDGKLVKSAYNAEKHMNIVTISKRSIRNGCQITLDAIEALPKELAMEAFAHRVGLSKPEKGASMESLLLAALSNPHDLTSQCILASAGVGAFDKLDTVYGYPDSKTTHIYTSTAVKADIKNCLKNPDDVARRRITKIYLGGREVLSEESEIGLDIPNLKSRNATNLAKISASSSVFPIGYFPGVWWLSQEKINEWVMFNWDTPRILDTIAMYDLGYWGSVLGGKLDFSDGTSIEIDNMSKDTSLGNIVSFAPRKVSWVKFTVTNVSPDTQLCGFSNMVVLESKK